MAWCRLPDSQPLYREAFLAAALCAQETKHVTFGPRGINPMTRHPAIAAPGAAEAYGQTAEGWGAALANLRARVDFGVDLRRPVR